jgi:hypothetical protein
MIDYPVTIDDPVKWRDILERHRIKESTWKQMVLEFQHYCPVFNPNIMDYVDDLEFCTQCSTFFHFEKKTIRGVKKEFLNWVKDYWQVIHADTFAEICYKCKTILNDYNEENPDQKLPFINWIPY